MKRTETILRLLHESQFMKIEELCEALKVSPATMRRDLSVLQEQGLVTRIGGGALPTSNPKEAQGAVQGTFVENLEQKRRIAQKAVQYIHPDDTLFLDSGSTNNEIAQLLVSLQPVSVVTNSIYIAYTLYANNPNNSVFVCGGNIGDAGIGSIVGPTAEMAISQFRANVFFMGCAAADTGCGITDPNLLARNIKLKMMENASKTILVCDSSKFGKIGKVFVSDLTRIHHVITDAGIPDTLLALLNQSGISVDVV